jgi:hypothetical protein
MSGNEYKVSKLAGTVRLEHLGGSSKSKHEGFVLKHDKGSIKLRRQEGNPFYDEYFEPFVGKTVTVKGYDMENYFLVTDIEEEKSAKGKKGQR